MSGCIWKQGLWPQGDCLFSAEGLSFLNCKMGTTRDKVLCKLTMSARSVSHSCFIIAEL